MKVFEIYLKVYLLEDIYLEDVQNEILRLIDITLGKTEKTLSIHKKNEFKNYCFNSFYPLEKDRVYKEGNIYTITIRTIDKYLASYFTKRLPLGYTPKIRGLKAEYKVLPFRKIKKIYSITPVVQKNDEGYWRGILPQEEFEVRLKTNLIKKYNNYFEENINEDFKLYDFLEIINKKPISNLFKGRKLLGDKVSIEVSDNEEAQKLAYMALGVGLGEMNARGFGYMGYRWE